MSFVNAKLHDLILCFFQIYLLNSFAWVRIAEAKTSERKRSKLSSFIYLANTRTFEIVVKSVINLGQLLKYI